LLDEGELAGVLLLLGHGLELGGALGLDALLLDLGLPDGFEAGFFFAAALLFLAAALFFGADAGLFGADASLFFLAAAALFILDLALAIVFLLAEAIFLQIHQLFEGKKDRRFLLL
jgi:hypothetical protein